MEWFRELYDIEDRCRNVSAGEQVLLRQSESHAVWERMRSWLAEAQTRTTNVILPKSDFASALQYIRNHFAELTRYVDDASIPIDNNETEQLMKQIAIGRNYAEFPIMLKPTSNLFKNWDPVAGDGKSYA